MTDASPKQRILLLESAAGTPGETGLILESLDNALVVHTLGPEDLQYRVQRERVDMVVIDASHDEYDGLQALRGTVEKLKTPAFVPFLVVVDSVDAKLPHAALGAGATDIIRKPLFPDAIRARANAYLASRMSHTQLAEARRNADIAARELSDTIQNLSHLETGRFGDKWNVICCYRPSKFFSGDFHDIFPVGDDKMAIVIADVLGRGVPVLAKIAAAQASVRTSLLDGKGPGEALTTASRVLSEQFDGNCLLTMYLGLLEASTGTLVHSTAGHEGAFLVKQDGSVVEASPPTGGPPLGVESANSLYEASTQELPSGSRFVLATNGIWNQKTDQGEPIGVDRYREFIHEVGQEPDPNQALANLLAKAREFNPSGEIRDDITLVMIDSK